MRENNLDARLKAADPVVEVELGSEVLHNATTTQAHGLGRKHHMNAAARPRFILTALAAAGALAITIPLTLSPGEPQYLLSVGDSQSSSMLGAKGAPGTEADQGVRDMMMWTQYNYLAGDSLGSEAGQGVAYKAKLNGSPTDYLLMLGRVFSIEGTPKESQYSSAEWPTWVLGPEDGSGPNVYLNWSGNGSWWYNDPSAWPNVQALKSCEPVASDGEVDQVDPDCSGFVETPIESGKVPTESELVEQANQIFTSAGVSFPRNQLRVSRDTWGASVEASMFLNGSPTAEMWWMSWSDSGALASVSGFAAEFEQMGTFNTVSQESAVSRLADYRYSGGVAYKFYNSGITLPMADGIDTRELDPESAPGPEILDLTIDSAESANVTIWASDNSVWILPGYVYYAKDAFAGAVFALEDGLVKLPALEETK